ncbi:MAG TPA: FUSC family protein [Candidatus Dormibacteraeota bacterium]|nr:FUSC family protein [Candidatus Dormibacteraeota bacterium]
MSAGKASGRLFNASGAVRRLQASRLLSIGPAQPGPALRRGALVSVPIGIALIVELGFNSPTQGAIATGALLAGFPGLDAPAGPRAAWQAATAPIIGLAAALGVLSSQSAVLAVLAMGLLGSAAGYCFAVSLRLAIAGLSVALALVIAQGLFLAPSEAWPALLYVTCGGLTQALWSLLVWVFVDRAADEEGSGWSAAAAKAGLVANLTLRSTSFRHALRFAAALAAGVATYRIFGFTEHGFWIPLTILFVMRPEREETFRRLVLRAVGTALGLIVATAVAETIGGNDLAVAIVLTISAALCFGLLTVQYALFTAAITTYVVLLADTLGEPAFLAAWQRAVGTAIGIAIAFVAFLIWPARGRAQEREVAPTRPAE